MRCRGMQIELFFKNIIKGTFYAANVGRGKMN